MTGRLGTLGVVAVALAAGLLFGSGAAARGRAASASASILYSTGLLCTHAHDFCSGIPRFNKAVYLIDRIGSPPRKITAGKHADDRAPVWSPDRGHIAFQRTENTSGGSAQIWVMNADGGGQKALTRGGSVVEGPYWLPDGRRLLFTGFQGPNGTMSLYRVNADGSSLARLVRGPAPSDIAYLSTSPDGKKIAFSTDEGSYVVNADGTGLRPLVPKGGSAPLLWEAPVWSPNGRSLAFVRNDHLWVMNADGSAQRKLAQSLPVVSRPVWSPNGARIAYTGVDSKDAFRLVVVNADGTGQKTSGPGVEGVPNAGSHLAWSPTGTRIVFIVHGQVSVMNPDGSGIRRVTSARTGYGILGVDW